MKVLLIGGTGRLSRDTTVMCVNMGYDVYLINRGSNNDMSYENLHYIISDINDPDDTVSKISGHEFDVVVDYLTFDLDALKKRIKTFDGRTRQYIFISSATVFLPNGEPISEDSPIGNDGWTYCKNKLACERYLQENVNDLSFAYTIVRPYVTYDRKRIPFPIISKKSNWNLIYRIENNLPILVCGDGEQSVALTSTKDFAVGIVGLFGNSSAYENDYNIVGDYNYTWNDVLKELEKFTGKKAVTVNIPMESVGKLVPSFREEVLFDKGLSHVFINAKIKSAVPEFRSTITLSDGMNETFSFLSQNKAQQVIDYEWNAMENVVASKLGYKDNRVSLGERWTYFKCENRLMRSFRR